MTIGTRNSYIKGGIGGPVSARKAREFKIRYVKTSSQRSIEEIVKERSQVNFPNQAVTNQDSVLTDLVKCWRRLDSESGMSGFFCF